MAEKEAPKKVAPRNDLESDALYKNSRALELQNRNPDFVYESFSTDPDSPAYIGKRLTAHERGNPVTGYAMVAAWEVVHSQTDADVRSLDPREDQGKAVDTVLRYGRQIMCRIPRKEYEKYQRVDEAWQARREKDLYEPDQIRAGRDAITTINNRDENADQVQMLRRAGHPFPGGQ
jgi:hypothetical protein